MYDFDKEIEFMKRNIFVSRAVSELRNKTVDLEFDLIMLAQKYDENLVKRACMELYKRNKPIKNLKSTLISYIITLSKK